MRWFLVVWTASAMLGAATLSAGYGPEFLQAEYLHIIGHFCVFGTLAWVVDRRARWRPAMSLALVLAIGASVEAAQAIASGHLSLRESGFDCAVNALAAMTGLALGCRRISARAVGRWLHPALLVPLGLAGAFYAAERNVAVAVSWSAIAALCWLPAAFVWLRGMELGRHGVDLVEAKDRPLLFLTVSGGASLFALIAGSSSAPDGVVAVAVGMTAMAITVTLLTTADLKISGHVSVALFLAVVVAPWSFRGLVLFLAAAVLLSWVRVRAQCRRPHEIAAAWALAAIAYPLSTLSALG